jgi:hypothetical protein
MISLYLLTTINKRASSHDKYKINNSLGEIIYYGKHVLTKKISHIDICVITLMDLRIALVKLHQLTAIPRVWQTNLASI